MPHLKEALGLLLTHGGRERLGRRQIWRDNGSRRVQGHEKTKGDVASRDKAMLTAVGDVVAKQGRSGEEDLWMAGRTGVGNLRRL